MPRPTNRQAPTAGAGGLHVCDGCHLQTNRLVRVAERLHVCADCWPEAQALLAAERTQKEETKQ